MTKNQLNTYPLDEQLLKFSQVHQYSCLAACLDFLLGNEDHALQHRWNKNRTNYTNNQYTDLSISPAPNSSEVAEFMAQDFDEAPDGLSLIQAPEFKDNNLSEVSAQAVFLTQLNEKINKADMVIFALVGHARIWFRKENKLFSPGLYDESMPPQFSVGSLLSKYDGKIKNEEKGKLRYMIDDNGNLSWEGENTPVILTLNYG